MKPLTYIVAAAAIAVPLTVALTPIQGADAVLGLNDTVTVTNTAANPVPVTPVAKTVKIANAEANLAAGASQFMPSDTDVSGYKEIRITVFCINFSGGCTSVTISVDADVFGPIAQFTMTPGSNGVFAETGGAGWSQVLDSPGQTVRVSVRNGATTEAAVGVQIDGRVN